MGRVHRKSRFSTSERLLLASTLTIRTSCVRANLGLIKLDSRELPALVLEQWLLLLEAAKQVRKLLMPSRALLLQLALQLSPNSQPLPARQPPKVPARNLLTPSLQRSSKPSPYQMDAKPMSDQAHLQEPQEANPARTSKRQPIRPKSLVNR